MMQNAAHPMRRVDVLGVGVNASSLGESVATIARWIAAGERQYVCITGAHGIMESRHDERFRAILNGAGMVTADGMPLVWFARLVRKAPAERVYGPDLMRALTTISPERGYRHFYYGGPAGLADRLKEVVTRDHPGLEVVGTLSPPFRELSPEEEDQVVAAINASRPDIVWVGLSTPKQELWMARHLGRIEAPVMIGVGAAFDFLAGTKPQAPLWMQRNGLEWLFRLATEPRRLWRRYGYIVPGFAALSLREFARESLRPGARRTRPQHS